MKDRRSDFWSGINGDLGGAGRFSRTTGPSRSGTQYHNTGPSEQRKRKAQLEEPAKGPGASRRHPNDPDAMCTLGSTPRPPAFDFRFRKMAPAEKMHAGIRLLIGPWLPISPEEPALQDFGAGRGSWCAPCAHQRSAAHVFFVKNGFTPGKVWQGFCCLPPRDYILIAWQAAS